MRKALICLLLLLPLVGAAQEQVPAAKALSWSEVTDDLETPVRILARPQEKERLYVVQRSGEVVIVERGKVLSEPLLDLSNIVNRKLKHGLMSVAFHPDFDTNKLFYAYFLDVNGDALVAQFRADPKRAQNEDDLTVTIKVAQSFANENGGSIAFGPDRLLYIGTGDGGGETTAARSPESLLGKILRIAPSESGGYKAPLDNPLRKLDGALPEIWALGFYSPESLLFDKDTGHLIVVDVQRNGATEIDIVEGGQSYGSRHPCSPPLCTPKSFVAPVATTPAGVTLLGGGIYRGDLYRDLSGKLIGVDPLSGSLIALSLDRGASTQATITTTPKSPITAVGVDATGEIVVASERGVLSRLKSN